MEGLRKPIRVDDGSTVEPAYVARQVKVYGVLEGEVSTISLFNTLATFFFSAGFSFVSMAVGIWADAAYVDNPAPAGLVLSHSGAPLLIVVAIACFGLAGWAVWNKGSLWKKIREESIQKGVIV